MALVFSQLFLVAALALLLSSSSAAAVVRRRAAANVTALDVPLYLKDDASGNIVAVVYYGVLGDRSKEIEATCTDPKDGEDLFVGPGSILCRCEAGIDCELTIPFRFQRDAAGNVVEVVYVDETTGWNDALVISFSPQKDSNGLTIGAVLHNNDVDTASSQILVVPFYPQKDSNGNIVAAVVEPVEASPGSSSSSSPGVVTVYVVGLLFAAILLAVAVVVAMRKIERKSSQEQTVAADKPAEDDATDSGSCIDA